eukprot:299961-Prymnesium_polylepis.1
MKDEEFYGARLYTGPMYLKYNSSLRFQGARTMMREKIKGGEEPREAKRAYLSHAKNEFNRLCVRRTLHPTPTTPDARQRSASPGAQPCPPPPCCCLQRGNKYVTSIHCINSAVVKLSKLTKVEKVRWSS